MTCVTHMVAVRNLIPRTAHAPLYAIVGVDSVYLRVAVSPQKNREMFNGDGEFDDFDFPRNGSIGDGYGDITGFDKQPEHNPSQWGSPVEDERDKSWDVKLFHAVRGKAEHAIENVEEALRNDADPNVFCEGNSSGKSTLALALTFKPMGPEREEVVRLLIREGAVFANDPDDQDGREQIETFMECATDLSHSLLFDLVYADLFNSVTLHDVMETMRWLIQKQENPERLKTCDMMSEFIHFAENILHRRKEQKNSDSDDQYSDDIEEEYSTLHDFLSGMVNGETLLHLVIERCFFNGTVCIPLLRILLDNGARLDVKDRHGQTPTELAKSMFEKHVLALHRFKGARLYRYHVDRSQLGFQRFV